MTAAAGAWPRPLTHHPVRARWGWALMAAVAINVGIVAGLALLGHAPAPKPPLAIRTLAVRPPTPPAALATPVASTGPVTTALPHLDLPPLPTALSAMPMLPPALPGVPLPALALDLPVGGPPMVAAADLDGPATLEGAFDLERHYPREARRRGITGSTVLLLTIGVDGRVQEAEVVSSTPPGIFEDAARHLGSTLRFRPARIAGQPAAIRQRMSVVWTLK